MCLYICPSQSYVIWLIYSRWCLRSSWNRHQSKSERADSLVRPLNFQVPMSTWSGGMNNRWSHISYYYRKYCGTAGWGSKGQIPHQIINVSCRGKPLREEGNKKGKRKRATEAHGWVDDASWNLFSLLSFPLYPPVLVGAQNPCKNSQLFITTSGWLEMNKFPKVIQNNAHYVKLQPHLLWQTDFLLITCIFLSLM